MQEIKLKGLDETIYYEKLVNGLRVYIWKTTTKKTFKGTLTYNVGSEDVSFKVGTKNYQVPYGTAHFLEHILCKKDDGTSLLTDFNRLGCYSNAATYGYKTVYEFMGSDNFYEALELLLNNIEKKNFVLEHFLSEKGPIKEEARRGLDSAPRLISEEINKGLFSTYPNRMPGVGTLDDIENIKLSDLELLYKSFYHPENCFLILTGNIEADKTIEFVKNHESCITFTKYKNPKKTNYKEPKKVVKKDSVIKINVETPKVYVSLKTPLKPLKNYDIMEMIDAINIVLNVNFGATSLLREDLINKKLVTTIGAYAYIERDYLIIQVVSKTKYPSKVLPILKDKLLNLEIVESDIIRKKNSEIANLVLGYEDVESVNDYLSYSLSKFNKIWDNEKEIIENMTTEKIKEIISKVSFDEISTLIVEPKKTEDK